MTKIEQGYQCAEITGHCGASSRFCAASKFASAPDAALFRSSDIKVALKRKKNTAAMPIHAKELKRITALVSLRSVAGVPAVTVLLL